MWGLHVGTADEAISTIMLDSLHGLRRLRLPRALASFIRVLVSGCQYLAVWCWTN